MGLLAKGATRCGSVGLPISTRQGAE